MQLEFWGQTSSFSSHSSVSVARPYTYRHEFWKNGWFNRGSIWGGGLPGPRKHALHGIRSSPEQQPFYGPLCGTTQVSQYEKKHLSTHTYPDQQSFFNRFLHLLWSTASSLFSLFAQPLSKSSLVNLLIWNPPLHTLWFPFHIVIRKVLDPVAICWSFFNSSRYSMIPFILFIRQLFHILLPRIFNPFLVYYHFTRYSFQKVWPVISWPSFPSALLFLCKKNKFWGNGV